MTDGQKTTGGSKRSIPMSAPSSSAESGTESESATQPIDLPIHASERFDTQLIERKQIQFAFYNPRTISETAKRKLRAAIGKVGLLGPVMWNPKTGNLVGGHQRVRALDLIHGSLDYRLHVSAVRDRDETEEHAANILMNNEEAQGNWDFDKLGEMVKMPDLDIVAAGFDAADIFKIIGDDAPDEVLNEMTERVRAAREAEQEIADRTPDAESNDFYLVVVFRDKAACDEAMSLLKVEDNRYANGSELTTRLRGGAAT